MGWKVSSTTKPHVPLLSATKGTRLLRLGFLGSDGVFIIHSFVENICAYTSFSYPVADNWRP